MQLRTQIQIVFFEKISPSAVISISKTYINFFQTPPQTGDRQIYVRLVGLFKTVKYIYSVQITVRYCGMQTQLFHMQMIDCLFW